MNSQYFHFIVVKEVSIPQRFFEWPKQMKKRTVINQRYREGISILQMVSIFFSVKLNRVIQFQPVRLLRQTSTRIFDNVRLPNWAAQLISVGISVGSMHMREILKYHPLRSRGLKFFSQNEPYLK